MKYDMLDAYIALGNALKTIERLEFENAQLRAERDEARADLTRYKTAENEGRWVYARTDMKVIPGSCAECKLGKKYGCVGDVKCKLLGTYFTGNVRSPHKQRPDECPLVLRHNIVHPEAQSALEAQGSEKPIYTEHDHEDYFTRKYRCGYCHAVLCQYNYGRDWCDDGKYMVKPSTCPNCGRKVDWSEIEEAQTDEH